MVILEEPENGPHPNEPPPFLQKKKPQHPNEPPSFLQWEQSQALIVPAGSPVSLLEERRHKLCNEGTQPQKGNWVQQFAWVFGVSARTGNCLTAKRSSNQNRRKRIGYRFLPSSEACQKAEKILSDKALTWKGPGIVKSVAGRSYNQRSTESKNKSPANPSLYHARKLSAASQNLACKISRQLFRRQLSGTYPQKIKNTQRSGGIECHRRRESS